MIHLKYTFTLHCNHNSLPTVQLEENIKRRGCLHAPALASAINFLLLVFSISFYFKGTVDYLLIFIWVFLFVWGFFFGMTKTREIFKNLIFFYIKTNLKYLTNIRKKNIKVFHCNGSMFSEFKAMYFFNGWIYIQNSKPTKWLSNLQISWWNLEITKI